jgi:hypothetical protein
MTAGRRDVTFATSPSSYVNARAQGGRPCQLLNRRTGAGRTYAAQPIWGQEWRDRVNRWRRYDSPARSAKILADIPHVMSRQTNGPRPQRRPPGAKWCRTCHGSGTVIGES